MALSPRWRGRERERVQSPSRPVTFGEVVSSFYQHGNVACKRLNSMVYARSQSCRARAPRSRPLSSRGLSDYGQRSLERSLDGGLGELSGITSGYPAEAQGLRAARVLAEPVTGNALAFSSDSAKGLFSSPQSGRGLGCAAAFGPSQGAALTRTAASPSESPRPELGGTPKQGVTAGAGSMLPAPVQQPQAQAPLRPPIMSGCSGAAGSSGSRLMASSAWSEGAAGQRSLEPERLGLSVRDPWLDTGSSSRKPLGSEVQAPNPRVTSFIKLNSFLLRTHITSLISALAEDGWLEMWEKERLCSKTREANSAAWSRSFLRHYVRFVESDDVSTFVAGLRAQLA